MSNQSRRRPPRRPRTGARRPPARKCASSVEPARPTTGNKPVAVDLQALLKAHASRSSDLADQLARVEQEMLEFLLSGEAPAPDTTLELIHSFERVRRSAAEDLRRSARLLIQINTEPVPVQVAVINPQHAQVVVQQPSQLGPTPPRGRQAK